MTDIEHPHLWLALSPHGYGHAAMTAPVVAEMRRRHPGLRLTIQTALPRSFLETRYGADFVHVGEIPDFGLRMVSATAIDRAASLADYRRLHADWPGPVRREAARLAAAKPDLVLANIPYVTIAAAASVGIPVVGLSSLNWADMVGAVLGGMAEAADIRAEMLDAYGGVAVMLRALPAMDMTLPKIRGIGPLARLGADRRPLLRTRLQVEEGQRVGLIAFGGIDHDLAVERMAQIPGWVWLSTVGTGGRADMVDWQQGGVAFADLISSVDLVVGKVGYGTFTEAALAGTPTIYLARPDWPESPALDDWLAAHTRCRAIGAEALFSAGFGDVIAEVLAQPARPRAVPSGVGEAADWLEWALAGNSLSS